MFYNFARAVLTPILNFVFNVKYIGQENLKAEGGYIICSNHRSLWDPMFIAFGEKKRRLNFMAKKELFKFKPFAKIIRSLGAFPVSRGSGDVGAIKNAVEVVNNGNILLIFPEGTRSKTGKPLRAKAGAVYIANETQAEIVPAAVCFEDKKLKIGCKVTVCYGKSISPDEIKISDDNKAADARKASGLVMQRIVDLMNGVLKNPVSVATPLNSVKEEKND